MSIGGPRTSLCRQSSDARQSFPNGRVRRSLAVKTRARASFPHCDFANPEAETCWLSCLFQSVWHSVVFHTVFDSHLTKANYSPDDQEMILASLQHTWEEYAARDLENGQESSNVAALPIFSDSTPSIGDDVATMGSAKAQAVAHLVPASDLVEAFGEGYGDMSEAFASLQQELSESPNVKALMLGAAMLTLPLAASGEDWPTPESAWSQLEDWQATETPLVAVDLSSSISTRDGIESLAQLWIPGTDAIDISADLGNHHKLVALVCYMWNLQHYVTFCRRQSAPSRCLFFNDLPNLTTGAPREVEWSDVPKVCGQYLLTPRLALYESLTHARDMMDMQ
jgi:hypothetical protein